MLFVPFGITKNKRYSQTVPNKFKLLSPLIKYFIVSVTLAVLCQGLVKHVLILFVFFKESGEKPDTMTQKDAAMFPIIASCALFGLYIFFQVRLVKTLYSETANHTKFPLQIISKDYINYLLTGYFFFLGILALTHLLSPVVSKLIPASVPNIPFHLQLVKGKAPQTEDLLNYEFTSHDLVCMGLCSGIGVWYLLKKVQRSILKNQLK